jgi:hypothetical protein
MWNQTPAHKRNLPHWFLRMLADNGHRLGWSDIEPRVPIVVPRIAVEMFLDDLLPPRQSVTPAHEEVLSHYTAVLQSS